MLRRIDPRGHSYRNAVFAVILVVALVLAAAGAGWWYSRHYPRASGPEEPMCLAFTQEDVQPFIGRATKVSEESTSTRSTRASGYWSCVIYGGAQRLYVQVTPQADKDMWNYKDRDVPIVNSLLTYDGVSVPVPGTTATVVTWSQGHEAFAGWFDDQTAVVVSTWDIGDDSRAAEKLTAITELVIRRAPPAARNLRLHAHTHALTPRTRPTSRAPETTDLLCRGNSCRQAEETDFSGSIAPAGCSRRQYWSFR